jgi:hypothetical protein
MQSSYNKTSRITKVRSIRTRAMSRANLVLGAAVAACGFWISPKSASAVTTLYWDPGTTGTGTWLNSNVWNTAPTNAAGNATWSTGDQAFFSNANVSTGSAYNVTLGSVSADSVIFNSAAPVNLSGGTLTLTGSTGISMNAGAGAVTLPRHLRLGAQRRP